MGHIPALTYTIRHSLDRLKRQHLYYEEEILKTRQLVFGMPGIVTTPSYGVVSGTDPVGHITGSTDPLVVTVNSIVPTTVDVNPGTLVFRSGVWMDLHAIVRQIALADPTVGIANVVYVQYQLEDAPLSLNDANQLVVPHTMRIGGTIDTSTLPESILVACTTVTNYLAFSTATLDDVVPVAIITNQQTSVGTVAISIDHTRASYSWNRPWFSVQDVEHRGQVGSGTVTAGNPHATGIPDLTAGDFTMMQLLLDYGMVVADDRDTPKVPGYRCTVEMAAPFAGPDVGGVATGYPGAMYYELPDYPVAAGQCWLASTSEPFPALHVLGTNRIVFPYEAPPGGDSLWINYNRVIACEPPVNGTTTFRSANPSDQELVIAGGVTLTSLINIEETMGDAYMFPQQYDFFVDGTGALLKTPQVVFCWKRLDDIGASIVPTITPYGPGRIMVGLSGAAVGFGTIQVSIVGVDTTGTTITDILTFTGGTWTDPGPPGTTTIVPGACQTTPRVFASVTNIQVSDIPPGHGPNAGIMAWSLQTPTTNYDKMKDALHVASATWNGYSFSNLLDRRIVSTTVKPDTNEMDRQQDALVFMLHAGGSSTIYCEDLRRPRYNSLVDPDDVYTNQHYPMFQTGKWAVGTTGNYRSIAFPVDNTVAGTNWRVSLFRDARRTPVNWNAAPLFLAYHGGMWHAFAVMTLVAGLPDTYECTTAAAPSRCVLYLPNIVANGYVLYG